MERNSYSYLSPKCVVVKAPDRGGHSVRALAPIAAGELIAVWGGRVVDAEGQAALGPEYSGHSLQVEEGLFLASLIPDDAADFVNHSCDPNGGVRGQITMLAMRDIAAGEEVTYDYAMTDSSPYDEFTCACGTALCRGRVTGDDWRRPDLWARYEGWFSSYLQRRIDKLRRERAKG